MLRPRLRAEEGFTLVELLVAVTLMGVIGTALVMSMTFMLAAKTRAKSDLDTSHDRQLVASYFTEDVEAAAGLRSVLDPAGSSGPSPVATGDVTLCGTALTAATSNVVVVTLTGQDYADTGITATPTYVSYVWRSDTHRLLRVACRGVGPVTTTVVASAVSSAPSLDAPCTGVTSAVGPTSSAADLLLTLPEVGGPSISLCGHRRSS